MEINTGPEIDTSNEMPPITHGSTSEGQISISRRISIAPQGLLSNGTIHVVPNKGYNLDFQVAETAKARVLSSIGVDGALRIGKDLLLNEPCARGIVALVKVRSQQMLSA